ncbi:thermopsin-like protein [Sulfolobus acidocaldarius SUSAZ]|nr:thermopsin-like protein [Sulfolobus acidocaldarius SUSAZ]
MLIRVFLIIVMLILPLTVTPLLPNSQAINSYPIGVSFFPLFSIYQTQEVLGEINISSLYIGNSYLSNGQYLTTGNASLQLNSMINGIYWAQDVILFSQINKTTFNASLVVNIWNLLGPFNLNLSKGIETTYQNLGVILYSGPSYIVKIPLQIKLFMIVNSSSLYFGYYINGHSGIFYQLPLTGSFRIGGFSAIGLPNDLELVFGGPGGGSSVQLITTANANLYFKDGNSLTLVPSALSTGLDTAETVIGINSVGNLTNLFKPSVVIGPGDPTPSVLWPVKPDIIVNSNNSSISVRLTYNNKPVTWQKVELYGVSLNGLYSLSNITTDSSGYAYFNTSPSLYVVYYPGNFTLSSTYYVSAPALNSLISSLKSAYDSLANFLSHYDFKNGISSFFSNAKNSVNYKSNYPSQYLILIYISSFLIGVVISALLIRFKH